MTRDELRAALATWVGEITEAAPPALTDQTDLVKDLGLDSLAIAELAARTRRQLKVKVAASDLVQDLRVGALVDLVLARLPK